MENLLLACNVVLPLFLMMALGYFLARVKLVDGRTLHVMNELIFKVFLAILLFYNIYTTDLQSAFDFHLLRYAALAVIGCFAAGFLLIPLIEKDNCKRGVLIQGICRSNFIIFGIPVVSAVVGDTGVGCAAVLIAVVVPLFNIFSVVALSVFRGAKIDFKKILLNIVTNPLIIASVLGICFLLLGWKLPGAIERTLGDLGKIATPLALVVLGGTFQFKAVKGYGKQLLLGVGGRLLLVPLICMPIAIALGFRGAQLVVLMSLFCSPTAVSSFTMAQQMDGDDTLAGALVVFGTLFSILTIFLWTFFLIQTGLVAA